MEKVNRRIFFWVLVVLFFVTTTFVISYAGGYRFDLKRGVFVHSGTITLKSNPTNVNVSIDGDTITSKKLNRINSSYSLGGFIPREYSVAVSAEGYKSWSKKIDVHSGLSTEFWNLVLVRNEYERTAYDASEIKKFFISPKSQRLIFVQNISGGFSTKILNLDDNKIENTFTFAKWNFIDDTKRENIEWSPQEDYLSVPAQRLVKNAEGETAEYAYFILNPSTNETFNLNDFVNMKNISHVRFDPKDKKYVFFLNGNSLYRSNIESQKDVVLIAENVANFDLSKTNVYFLQLPNSLVYKTSLDGQSQKEQITKNFPDGSFLADNNFFVVYDDSRIAFINKKKELVLYNGGLNEDEYFKKLSDNVEGIQFSDDGKKMLYFAKNEISVFFLTDWGVQPFRARNDSENITRYSEEIKNVQWFNKDYEHVIFSIGKQIKIIELDPRDQRNCSDLSAVNVSDPFLIYNNTMEKLLFIDEAEGVSNLFSIIFPEKTTILGF